MGDWTTVPVRKETRDRLEKHPEKSGRDWDTFLRREVLGDDIDTDEAGPVAVDELPPDMVVVNEATEEQLAAIRERLEQLPERTAEELEERFR